MRALKIKFYGHTYLDTNEIQHYAINGILWLFIFEIFFFQR